MKTRRIVAALVLIGVALRAVQYFSGGSLWVDEAALALNLASRSFGELFRPLDLAQVAPWGFLLIEKGLLSVFGRSALGLRLLPFVASLGALILFARLARQTLPGRGAAFAVGCFALATGLIDYAGQLKQYSTDVAASLTVLVLAFPLARGRPALRRVVAAALAGLTACFFSQPVVFVLAGVGLALVILAALRKLQASLAALSVVAAAWALGALFVLSSVRRTGSHRIDDNVTGLTHAPRGDCSVVARRLLAERQDHRLGNLSGLFVNSASMPRS